MLIVIAVFQIKPGKMDQALEAVQAFMPKVRTEPGTLEYTVYRGVGDANMLAFFEQYPDQDALAAHGSSEEFKAFQQAATPCIDGQPIMGVVEEVASTHQ
jgi:quinol monooxygenase YgiN